MAAIESKVLIDTGTTATATRIDLAEQQLLDCASAGAGFDSQGCQGGYLIDPFIYASRQGSPPRRLRAARLPHRLACQLAGRRALANHRGVVARREV